MEFEMTPGAKVTTNRNLALISLHHDFTKYLERINERVRPIELPLMELNKRGGLYYYMKDDWKERATSFAENFELRFPEIEQVYVFSIYNSEKIFNPEPFMENHYPDSVSEALSKELNPFILKRFLIISCPKLEEITISIPTSRETSLSDKSSDYEIKRTVERSLRFNSW